MLAVHSFRSFDGVTGPRSIVLPARRSGIRYTALTVIAIADDRAGSGGMLATPPTCVLLSVAQTLSFTQAARRLGLRQSTVSQHVRRLEEATGRQLFSRDTHSVELTEDGEAMLGFARRILEVHEQATAFFTGTRLRGRLRFGASEDFVLTPSSGDPGVLPARSTPRSTWS